MAETILVGCDSAAAELRDEVVEHLAASGFVVRDLGAKGPDDAVPYPDVAEAVCLALLGDGPARRAILLCGTGIGMAIAANKFKGVYAAVIHDAYSAERACLSNDINVAALGARVVGRELALKLLDQWLGLSYKSGRSDAKLARIRALEDRNFK